MSSFAQEFSHFKELLEHACLRPAMYVGDNDFERLCHFLMGYSCGHARGFTGRRDSFLGDSFFGEHWNAYLHETRGWAKNICWISHIKNLQAQAVFPKDESEFTVLLRLYHEFYEKHQSALIQLAEQAE